MRRFRWGKLAQRAVLLVIFVLDIWVTASYLDVIMHNSAVDPAYQGWNLFTMLPF